MVVDQWVFVVGGDVEWADGLQNMRHLLFAYLLLPLRYQ